MHSAQFQLHAKIEQDHWWFVARRAILRRLVREVLPADRNAVIVDVARGTPRRGRLRLFPPLRAAAAGAHLGWLARANAAALVLQLPAVPAGALDSRAEPSPSSRLGGRRHRFRPALATGELALAPSVR